MYINVVRIHHRMLAAVHHQQHETHWHVCENILRECLPHQTKRRGFLRLNAKEMMRLSENYPQELPLDSHKRT